MESLKCVSPLLVIDFYQKSLWCNNAVIIPIICIRQLQHFMLNSEFKQKYLMRQNRFTLQLNITACNSSLFTFCECAWCILMKRST